MFEGSSLLLDVVGVIIAFSVVMLLLSIMVTALAQASQAALRLRARNLQRGLASVLERELPVRKDESRQYAATLLNSPEIAQLRRRGDPNSFFSWLRGPIVSWLDPATLREALDHEHEAHETQEPETKEKALEDEAGTVSEAEAAESTDAPPPDRHIPEPASLPPGVDIDSTVDRFERLDDLMSKRFGVAMRVISLCWAVLVAVIFQVSTPQLLRQLSTDPGLRAEIVALAPEVLEYGEGAIARLSESSDSSGKALKRLLERYPQLRSRVEDVELEHEYPEDAAEHLAAHVEDLAERAEIVAEYEELLDQELERQRTVALAEAQTATDHLARMNVTPWRYGRSFYWRDSRPRVGNILGILTTAVLLTLGAPFWFNTLKRSLALRDRLSTVRESDKQDEEGARQPVVVNVVTHPEQPPPPSEPGGEAS